MEALNKFYINSCRPKCIKYEKITDTITLISDFFENFEEAKDFFVNREKWECIPYQNHSKRGYESLFPDWVGKSLMENYIVDNKIIDDLNSYKIICNYFYHNEESVWSITNSTCFPHVDSFQIDDEIECICLINLNDVSVSTQFYSYKNKEYCPKEMENEWNKYNEYVNGELLEFYNKKNITSVECKRFLEEKEYSDIKLIREVEYKPNQAIVYPANLFHSPKLTSNFTKDNPRILLKISFFKCINNFK